MPQCLNASTPQRLNAPSELTTHSTTITKSKIARGIGFRLFCPRFLVKISQTFSTRHYPLPPLPCLSVLSRLIFILFAPLRARALHLAAARVYYASSRVPLYDIRELANTKCIGSRKALIQVLNLSSKSLGLESSLTSHDLINPVCTCGNLAHCLLRRRR